MIVGIGSDIVEHDSNAKLLAWDKAGRLPDRILSHDEMILFKQTNSANFIAGRFAGKEAVLKSLGSGMQDGLSLKDISIIPSPCGQPRIELFGSVKDLAVHLGINKWHLSITHSESYSVAFVIAEKV